MTQLRQPERGMRELRMAHTGHPAPFRLGAPAYLAALAGWLAASIFLLFSAPDLTNLAIGRPGPVAAAHAVGLVFFPFAVAAAGWQLLPGVLRNDPPLPRLRWVTFGLLAAGIPLALAIRTDREQLGAVCAVLLGAGLVLLLLELASLIRGAPPAKTLVVSRLPVGLGGIYSAAAFAAGAAVRTCCALREDRCPRGAGRTRRVRPRVPDRGRIPCDSSGRRSRRRQACCRRRRAPARSRVGGRSDPRPAGQARVAVRLGGLAARASAQAGCAVPTPWVARRGRRVRRGGRAPGCGRARELYAARSVRSRPARLRRDRCARKRRRDRAPCTRET